MNRYKFSEEEVPYGILESFGLTREMIGDLPVDVLQAIHHPCPYTLLVGAA